jgi:hypothetical protein
MIKSIKQNTTSVSKQQNYYETSPQEKLRKVLKDSEIVRNTQYLRDKAKQRKKQDSIGVSCFSQIRVEIQSTINAINDMKKIKLFSKKINTSPSYNKITSPSKPKTNFNELNLFKKASSGQFNSGVKTKIITSKYYLNNSIKAKLNDLSNISGKNTFLTGANINKDHVNNLALNKKSSLSRFNYYTLSKKDSTNFVLTSRNQNSYSLNNESTKKGLTPSSIQVFTTNTEANDFPARHSVIKTDINLTKEEFSNDEYNNQDNEGKEMLSSNKKPTTMSISQFKKEELPKRLRKFKVKLIKNYYEKKKLSYKVLPKSIITDLDYQSTVIIDEIKVLLDNSETFRLQLLTNENMTKIFKALSKASKIEVNYLLEESIGLMMEISVIILNDFSKYLDKFVSVQPPTKERLKDTYVVDEELAFTTNTKLFSDVMMFTKGCYEVYLVLIKQEDDIILDYIKYNEVSQYLNRARYNISTLIFIIKSYFKNSIEDEKLCERFITEKQNATDTTDCNNFYDKYQSYSNQNNIFIFNKTNSTIRTVKHRKKISSKLINDSKEPEKEAEAINFIVTKFKERGRIRSINKSNDSKLSNYSKNSVTTKKSVEKEVKEIIKPKKPKNISLKYENNNKKITDRTYKDLSEKIKAQFTYKLNEKVQRVKQLNSLLNRKIDKEDFYSKLKLNAEIHESCLNSNLINQMLRFVPKVYKERIISQRIIERFKDKNNYSDED